MTNQEMSNLVAKYFDVEGYTFPDGFEHRFEPDSSAILYSILREYQPKVCLEVGSWMGGSTCVIQSALIKNDNGSTLYVSEIADDLRKSTELNVLNKCGVAPVMMGDITKNLEEVPQKLDFAFIDTNHDLDTTKWIVANIFPRIKKGGLLAFHDWAVSDKTGEWIGKNGMWPETQYLIDLHNQNKFPFEKIFWTWENPYRDGIDPQRETGIWKKL